jgi:hypothetical protein
VKKEDSTWRAGKQLSICAIITEPVVHSMTRAWLNDPIVSSGASETDLASSTTDIRAAANAGLWSIVGSSSNGRSVDGDESA